MSITICVWEGVLTVFVIIGRDVYHSVYHYICAAMCVTVTVTVCVLRCLSQCLSLFVCGEMCHSVCQVFSFFYASLRVISCVMSLAWYPQLVSQTPDTFIYSKLQAICNCCFSRQSICTVISFDSGLPGQCIHRVFSSSSTLELFPKCINDELVHIVFGWEYKGTFADDRLRWQVLVK